MTKQKSQLENWRKVKFGEVITLHRGYDLPVEKMIRGNYPVIFSNGKIEYHNEYKIKGPGVVTGRSGALGNIFYIKEDFWPHNTTLYISDFHGNDPKFVYYFLKKFDFSNFNSGTGVPTLNRNFVHEAEVTFSDKIEIQKHIASILSAFDDKIELNNKINQSLEQMASTIFKEWFVKNSKIKNQNAKLNELVKTQYGYTESASEKEVGPKFLRVTDINKTDWINWSMVPYCKISRENYPKYKLKKGDVVIARMADPGKVAIVEEDIGAVFASYLIRLQIVSEAINPYFLFYYLRSRLYQNFIFGASTGTTRQSANARVITDVDLTVPPKEKVLEFENIASTIRSKILVNVKENQTLSSLRDLLLPKLMSGEIRV